MTLQTCYELPEISEAAYMKLAALPEVAFYDNSLSLTPLLVSGEDFYTRH